MTEPEKIDEAANQFLKAIEKMGTDRRVMIAWAYADPEDSYKGDDSWINYRNTLMTEKDWGELVMKDTALRLITHLCNLIKDSE